MHELFTKVLGKRDLSRAGDLFSVADAEIVADLTEVVSGEFVLFSRFYFSSTDRERFAENRCQVTYRYIDRTTRQP